MRPRLNAGDICIRDVAAVAPDVGIGEAAALMRERHVGALVVVEKGRAGDTVVGMLTDRDIVTSMVAKGVDPARLSVGDVMAEPVTVRMLDPLADVLGTMRRLGVRRMPVVDDHGALVGLVSLTDLLVQVARELGWIIDTIHSGRRHEAEARP